MHPLLRVLRRPEPGELAKLDPSQQSALVEAAQRHGLSAYLWRLLGEHRQEELPPTLLELRPHSGGVVASGLKARKLLFATIDALAEEGITPTLLKGYGLAARLWPHPLLRPCSDVDLLVRDEELAAATRVAGRLGLTQFVDPGEDEPFEHHHHLCFSGEAGILELHFRPFSGFGGTLEQLRTTPQTLERRAVQYLAPEDELVYLAAHAAKHLFARVSWLLDLKFFLGKQPSLDWARVETLAKHSGLKAAMYCTLVAVERGLGYAAPEPLLAAVRPAVWQRELIHRFLTADRLVDGTAFKRRGAASFFRVLLSDDPKAAMRQLSTGARRTVLRDWRRRGYGNALGR